MVTSGQSTTDVAAVRLRFGSGAYSVSAPQSESWMLNWPACTPVQLASSSHCAPECSGNSIRKRPQSPAGSENEMSVVWSFQRGSPPVQSSHETSVPLMPQPPVETAFSETYSP